ncbi:hypothetical protein HF650_05530 [Kosakonia sp. SMBL-WEM22]|uniref:hypothetical protein n=1 Tax=Kosakonia sp. SMBL-WEM22 TaxID=2725560 RepID=UPI00165930F9|nr:hypothetical protein [Kosakonia sp. SMBL-WEM22]QNQ19252.1 hypothetical protein HF650_05530 [Kosakonia sp. SMBL-WEM22]
MRFFLSLPYLRWSLASLIEKTGRMPLLAALFPLLIVGYWQCALAPENRQLLGENAQLELQLDKPLAISPQLKNSAVALQRTLNDTEYQQVKAVFDIFQQNHLQVDGSRYQFGKNGKEHQRALALTIPLQGEWNNLTRSLITMSKSLIFHVDRLAISRASPESAHLLITLQLTLSLASGLEA